MAVKAVKDRARASDGALRIGDLAKRTGLTLRTIRYYEELGLLESVKRLDGGVRVYTSDDVRRLRFIQRLKMLGLSLQEMLELERLYRRERTNRAVLPKLIDMLDRHLAQIGDRVAELEGLRDQIKSERDRISTRLGEE
ncbi:MAG TPA: MerR family transcriptional regulator [Candidatus Dormibacteraeota bacterium]|nr:MerR family transcriptional regulator [Candidatus Dormibacteraeota bacterium]